MYKVIIADDERVAREAIAKCIDWNGLGLELAAQCANGIEAYHAILDLSPQIAILDIRMPGFNGLEIIRQISEIDPDIHFILLSGYSEFEYAQTAMRYGVRHYLLKPANKQEISDCLNEVIEECRAAEQQHSVPPFPEEPQEESGRLLTTTDNIKQYVREHLSNPDLTLKWIAENYLFMNVDYVSKRFLKDEGERFSAFLTRIRVETAMEMLNRNPYEKIRYISKIVGCDNNPQYFSQIFKKQTGMTPSEYAASVLEKQQRS